MDPAHISQRVDPDYLMTGMGAKRLQRCSAIPSDPVSRVLDDDDLLIEIMIRLGFPTSLVRASLVCRRWFHHASDPSFLRRFRKLHPPRILGFYVYTWCVEAPLFVPMAPQPPELASVFRRARFGVGNPIIDCQNGTVSFGLYRHKTWVNFASRNLLCPERGMSSVLPLPHHQVQEGNIKVFDYLILNEEGASFSYCYVVTESNKERTKSTVHVYTLQYGVWCMHISVVTELPCQLKRKPLLVGNKIYILASSSDILVFDMTAISFSTFKLPQGLDISGKRKGTMLSRADDHSGIYLINLNELQLCIWLYDGDKCLLVDTIYLREMLDKLRFPDDKLEDRHTTTPRLSQVGDNAEFALLEIARCILYLDIKCRTLRKVYDMTTDDYNFHRLQALTMIWPPKFPALKDDPSRNKDAT